MEHFKDIPWYEWLYQISKEWKVKSLYKNIILKEIDNWKGYKAVSLYKNKSIRLYIHRLVLLTYVWYSNLECNHKDWDKSNNTFSNLEYCTRSENEQHKHKVLWYKSTFLWKIWKLNHNSIKIKQFNIKWELLGVWDCAMDVTRKLKIDNSSIIKCCRWKLGLAGGFNWKYY